MYKLTRFHKTKSSLLNTINAERTGANEQNTHITLREKDNFKNG